MDLVDEILSADARREGAHAAHKLSRTLFGTCPACRRCDQGFCLSHGRQHSPPLQTRVTHYECFVEMSPMLCRACCAQIGAKLAK